MENIVELTIKSTNPETGEVHEKTLNGRAVLISAILDKSVLETEEFIEAEPALTGEGEPVSSALIGYSCQDDKRLMMLQMLGLLSEHDPLFFPAFLAEMLEIADEELYHEFMRRCGREVFER